MAKFTSCPRCHNFEHLDRVYMCPKCAGIFCEVCHSRQENKFEHCPFCHVEGEDLGFIETDD